MRCSKCKLYRFDKEGSSAGEWKERGVGQVFSPGVQCTLSSGSMTLGFRTCDEHILGGRCGARCPFLVSSVPSPWGLGVRLLGHPTSPCMDSDLGKVRNLGTGSTLFSVSWSGFRAGLKELKTTDKPRTKGQLHCTDCVGGSEVPDMPLIQEVSLWCRCVTDWFQVREGRSVQADEARKESEWSSIGVCASLTRSDGCPI